jgi:hypothetical protein
MSEVLDEIVNLPTRFTLNDVAPWRPEEERTKLDDPMTGVYLNLQWNIQEGVVTGDRERSALHWCRVAEHYVDNVTLLLAFLLDDLQQYRESKKRDWPERLRLPLDLEKMFSDTRALLDGLYCLALLYQSDARGIPRSKQRSFGQFSDWFEKESRVSFAPPLGYLQEVVPWAQDIRALRDGYVHRGHKSLVFYGDTELYLDPSAHRRPPRLRVLPDHFYAPSNPNNLIVVEKFLVFIIAPIFAVRRKLGDCLHAMLQALPGWRHHGVGMPYREGPENFRMRDWLRRNRDALDPAIFKQQHFSRLPGP